MQLDFLCSKTIIILLKYLKIHSKISICFDILGQDSIYWKCLRRIVGLQNQDKMAATNWLILQTKLWLSKLQNTKSTGPCKCEGLIHLQIHFNNMKLAYLDANQ